MSTNSTVVSVNYLKALPINPIISQITRVFEKSIHRVITTRNAELDPKTVSGPIIISTSKFADYQCNNAMKIFKSFKNELSLKSPFEFASLVQEDLEASSDKILFSSVETAKAGFISVKLAIDFLTSNAHRFDEIMNEKASPIGPKALVDFSSPNIAKEMHVGHLRSTIIGDTCCRVLEHFGFNVERINHVGDWGTQFGMLITYLTEKEECHEEANIADLTNFYKAAKNEFDIDPEFKKRSQLAVVALQRGDENAREKWDKICKVSRDQFAQIYQRLNISLIERGESFYNPLIPSVVEELATKFEPPLLVESDGAKVVFTDIDDVPLIVVKSDGGYGYDTTDLAAIRYRILEQENAWVVYITDAGQGTHFYKVFDAAKKAKWLDDSVTRVDHIGFGVVCGEDGKKFKTRSGEVTKLVDLLDEAQRRAKIELINREKEISGKDNIEGDKLEEISQNAEKIGIAAIKYFDLKQNHSSNYSFSFDKMLDAKGNTAVYLLYAYARICSILAKSKFIDSELPTMTNNINDQHERKLLVAINRFYDVILSAAIDLHFNRICEYLYDLVDIFTSFYTNCKVIDNGVVNVDRLVLCVLTKRVMSKCFTFLGIEPLEKL